MSELRWTLLILGMVFIAALSWWERRRPRQAFAPRLREASLSHTELPHTEAHRTASAEPAGGGEPWIGETGLSDVVRSEVTFTDAAHQSAAESGARAPHESHGPGPLAELPTLLIPDEEARHALEVAWSEQPPEPKLIDPESRAAEEAAIGALEPIEAKEDTAESEAIEALEPIEATDEAQESEEAIEELEPIAPAEPASVPATGASRAPSGSDGEIPGAEGVGAVRVVQYGFDGGGASPIEPIVEWPPEESRRILALRLVAPQPERFPGRSLRLALAAEGFLLGKFSIFHKPDESNRAVLSAASLTRPGSFDLETMDSQRYGGLSLFVVLPGPKRPPEAFEELVASARNLNERLQGALQDERGGPLTSLRVSGILEGLKAEATIVPPATSAVRKA